MAQQTINVGTAPNDGTGTPLRTAFQYTNSNFSELYTAVGPSGNNIVVPGTATITGDLTVDTNTLKVDSANDNVGIGTTTPASYAFNDPAKLVIANTGTAGAGNTFTIASGSTGFGQIAFANGTSGTSRYNGYIKYSHSTNAMEFYANAGALQATLNSTGLGVGDAPTADCKLTVRGGAFINRGAAGGASQLLVSLAASSGGNFGQISNTGTRWALGYGPTLTTVGTEALIWDSSGNVGIGVTPEAWTVFNPVLRIKNASTGGGGALGGTGIDNFRMLTNTYYDGQYKRIGLGYATIYEQASGAHVWYSNGSGSAGSTFTPTQAMTLDASGNLCVGTATAVRKLTVYDTTATPAQFESSTTDCQLTLVTSSGSGGKCFIQASAGALLLGSSASERARIDASGTLLVGVTSANASGGVLQLKSGITFPATQVASSDANTLDDYEEGTWTGTLTGGTTNPTTPVTATGRYTKVGRVVTVQITFLNANTTGASGLIGITGLPFANNGSSSSAGAVSLYLIGTFTGSPFASLGVNESFINFYANTSGGAFNDVTHNAGTPRFLTTSITYTV